MVKNYRLRVAQARHFDPEGYINEIRVNKLKEKGYFHSFVEREHLIRNALPHEVEQRRKKWDLMNKFERERKQEDPNFVGSFLHFRDDFTRMSFMLRKAGDIIKEEL